MGLFKFAFIVIMGLIGFLELFWTNLSYKFYDGQKNDPEQDSNLCPSTSEAVITTIVPQNPALHYWR